MTSSHQKINYHHIDKNNRANDKWVGIHAYDVPNIYNIKEIVNICIEKDYTMIVLDKCSLTDDQFIEMMTLLFTNKNSVSYIILVNNQLTDISIDFLNEYSKYLIAYHLWIHSHPNSKRLFNIHPTTYISYIDGGPNINQHLYLTPAYESTKNRIYLSDNKKIKLETDIDSHGSEGIYAKIDEPKDLITFEEISSTISKDLINVYDVLEKEKLARENLEKLKKEKQLNLEKERLEKLKKEDEKYEKYKQQNLEKERKIRERLEKEKEDEEYEHLELDEEYEIIDQIEEKQPETTVLYVLKLEQGKYYVGITTNFTNRLQQHKDGCGSTWTKKYKFIKTLSTENVPTKYAPAEETKRTYELMLKYGIHNVGGAEYSQVDQFKNKNFQLNQLIFSTN